ncbi:hypothetical protein [Frigoribacterium sp. PhB24]|uniref:hypothetical protein n=1 Tax=Frigoribacterium sp. PhB24 TaxID=2485204 RepID=UPI000F4A6FEA|nr:hypothetical protein [Frigoribacterium sp. PhB24]ROS48923.1 hypothetical protein EDF50_2708 [Frigoribacterium sp. PhB24]
MSRNRIDPSSLMTPNEMDDYERYRWAIVVEVTGTDELTPEQFADHTDTMNRGRAIERTVARRRARQTPKIL